MSLWGSPRAPLLLFCVTVLWFPELIPVGAGVGETSLSSFIPQRLGGDGFCTSLFPGWGILHLAVRWPDVLGPLPLRPHWACEGLIPTASDKGNSCKTLICCLQTRLWGDVGEFESKRFPRKRHKIVFKQILYWHAPGARCQKRKVNKL